LSVGADDFYFLLSLVKRKLSARTNNQIFGAPANQISPSLGTEKKVDFSSFFSTWICLKFLVTRCCAFQTRLAIAGQKRRNQMEHQLTSMHRYIGTLFVLLSLFLSFGLSSSPSSANQVGKRHFYLSTRYRCVLANNNPFFYRRCILRVALSANH